jgi:hypothetical protein
MCCYIKTIGIEMQMQVKRRVFLGSTHCWDQAVFPVITSMPSELHDVVEVVVELKVSMSLIFFLSLTLTTIS